MTLKLFISHSSHDEPARRLRDAVANHLDGLEDIEVLWDADINPGDRWRAELDEWLAECDGGVILFSADAIASSWVLKEAQILTWRKAVIEAFPLVPVLLAPVEAEQTEMDDWQPVRINEIQFLSGADPAGMTDVDRVALAEQIADAVRDQAGDIEFDDIDDPLGEWTEYLAEDLEKVGLETLQKAAQALKIERRPGRPPATKNELARMIARRVLHYGSLPTVVGDPKESFDEAADVLRKLVRTLDEGSRKSVAERFLPMWVPPDAARHITPCARNGIAVCINGEEWETGREYADRATFGKVSELLSWVAVPDLHGGDANDIVTRYHREIMRKFHLGPYEPATWDDAGARRDWDAELDDVVRQRRGQVFVLLWRDASNGAVLDELRRRYPPFFFVMMLGDRSLESAGLAGKPAVLLEPAIPVRRESAVRRTYDLIIRRN